MEETLVTNLHYNHTLLKALFLLTAHHWPPPPHLSFIPTWECMYGRWWLGSFWRVTWFSRLFLMYIGAVQMLVKLIFFSLLICFFFLFFQNLEIQVKLFFPPLPLYQLINVLWNRPFYKSFTKHCYVLFHLSALTFALIHLES